MKSRGIGRGKHGKQKLITDSHLRGKDKTKLNYAQKEELMQFTIDLLMNGASNGQMIPIIQAESPVPLSYNNAYSLLQNAVARLQEVTKQDFEQVLAVHTGYYERIFAYFKETGNHAGMLKAMKAKEKLNGIVKEKERRMQVEIIKKTVITKEVSYDLSKLDEADRARFESIMERIKR